MKTSIAKAALFAIPAKAPRLHGHRLIPLRLLLSVNFFLSTGVVLLSAAASFGFPIRNAFLPVSAILLILLGWQIFYRKKGRFHRRFFLFLLVATIIPFFAIWPAIQKRSFVSYFNDTWLYVSLGQYLNDYPRGTDGGLSPVDQYSAWLSNNARFGTPTLLAFMSDLTGTTTAEVLTPWVCLTIFCIFVGLASLCWSFRMTVVPIVAVSTFFVLCGWLHVALFVGNLDNFFFFAIFPFALVRYDLFVRGEKPFAAMAGLAVTLAACFYTYPEGTAIAGVAFFPWLALRFFRDHRRRLLWKPYLLLLASFLFLLAPYIPTLIGYLPGQLRASEQHPYPGEGFFPGLLSPDIVSGIFALGGEAINGRLPAHWLLVDGQVLATVLFLLLLNGLIAWWRNDKGLIFSLLAVGCLAVWQGYLHQYDYGLYKILFIGSLLWIPCIFQGIESLSEVFPTSTRHFIAFGLASVICCSGVASRNANAWEYLDKRIKISDYSALKQLRQTVDDKPVTLICYDDFDQQWAAFYLRNLKLKIGRFTPYFSAAAPFIQRARGAEGTPDFIVSDYPVKQAAWTNGRFSLVAADSPPEIVAIDAPLNTVTGKKAGFIWLGNEVTHFYCSSDKEQAGCFSARGLPGPSRPGDSNRTVTLRSDQETLKVAANERFSCPLRLHKGLNKIDLWCNEQRTVFQLENSDTRTLLLGLVDFSISTAK